MSIQWSSNSSLVFQAEAALRHGWSVIPLLGQDAPAQAKVPAIPSWKVYQSRLPTLVEVNQWFSESEAGHKAMGVVTGRVSRLVVIDLDSPETEAAFKGILPDLLDTFMVSSGNRGLPHLYYTLLPGTQVKSRHAPGIELRSDGQYVVAPGTQVNDRAWRIVKNRAPRLLTPDDLNRIQHFIGQVRFANTKNGGKPLSRAINTPSHGEGQPSTRIHSTQEQIPPQPGERPTAQQMISRYRRLVPEHGRNNALFLTSQFARDCGLPRFEAEHHLVTIHVHQPPVTPHAPESVRQREIEAKRTIASAYSWAAAKQHTHDQNRTTSSNKQLPNAVRERLLQLGLGNVARVLDGMLMVGYQAGAVFSAQVLYQTIRLFGIGRNCVYAVLRAVLEGGRMLFSTTEVTGKTKAATAEATEDHPSASPLYPPSPDAIAANRSAMDTNQCLFGSPAKAVKNQDDARKRGRPTAMFRMPSVPQLCEWLGVKARYSDPLAPEDLQSMASYRAALHRALIQRAPGQYGRAWQAGRLGVSEDSCRRYDKRTGIQVTPLYTQQAIYWSNVDQKLPDEPIPGCTLQDDEGRRYPAKKQIAQRLLSRGKRLILRRQLPNHYAVGYSEAQSDASQQGVPSINTNDEKPQGTKTALTPAQDGFKQPLSILPAKNPGRPQATAPEDAIKKSENPLSLGYVKPTPCAKPPELKHSTVGGNRTIVASSNDIAPLAERLYTIVRDYNPDKSLTRKTAERLVKTYGPRLVKRGIKVLEQRRNIRNPAGFIKVWLHSEAKFC